MTALREAAAIAANTLVFADELVKPGALTEDIDSAIREFIFDAGAYPAPLNYAGFPKSCCISLNEVCVFQRARFLHGVSVAANALHAHTTLRPAYAGQQRVSTADKRPAAFSCVGVRHGCCLLSC
jgi:hypothetical protein